MYFLSHLSKIESNYYFEVYSCLEFGYFRIASTPAQCYFTVVIDETPTFPSSLLSALLAKTTTTKKMRIAQQIVTSTEILPDSARLPNSAKTLSKSIGFGA